MVTNNSAKQPVFSGKTNPDEMDNKYELIKNLFLFQDRRHLVDIAEAIEGSFDNLMCVWLVKSDLTENQKKLNEELLNIFSAMKSLDARESDQKLKEFLQENDNQDLKTVLNCERGESGLTVLHVISSMAASEQYDRAVRLLLKAGADPHVKNDREKTPLHYATGLRSIGSLLEEGADPNAKDNEGRTPLHCVASIGLYQESLRFFLGKGAELNVLDKQGKTPLEVTLGNCHGQAWATSLKGLDYNGGEYLFKSEGLWSSLKPDQQAKLGEFLDKVSGAQNMDELEEVVRKAIQSGVRFNRRFSQDKKCNFTDRVMEKISKLSESEKNYKVASDIVCKLVSIGAVLYNENNMKVIDTVESEFEDHKKNMVEAYEGYLNSTLKFMEVIKSATIGTVRNAKMDNTTLYLECSKYSKINVARLTDGARELRLAQGSVEYERNIVKVGESEVEIET